MLPELKDKSKLFYGGIKLAFPITAMPDETQVKKTAAEVREKLAKTAKVQ